MFLLQLGRYSYSHCKLGYVFSTRLNYSDSLDLGISLVLQH